MLAASVEDEEDAMPFPDSFQRSTLRDALMRMPRSAWVGGVALLAFALAGALIGFGSCSPEPAFMLSSDAAEASSADAVGSEQEQAGVREKDSSDDRPDAGDGASEDADASPERIAVYVSGAVVSPGVYALDEGSRVCDAVTVAGGLCDDAARESVNLARKVSDGEQIAIPTQEQVDSGTAAPQENAGAQEGLASAGGAASSKTPAVPVNINTAGVEELDSLAGIGLATAQAIIDEREANGPFASVEDIQRVSGIGEKKFEKLKESICV